MLQNRLFFTKKHTIEKPYDLFLKIIIKIRYTS